MFHSLLFFVFFLKADISILTNAAACNALPMVPAIIRGSSPAPKCRFPYLVSLRHHRWGTHTCSGTLIKSRYILTSASCASLVGKGTAKINGYYRKGPFEEAISIETFKRHPNFVLGRIANDVAIVKLAQPSSQQTVRLPSSSGTPSKGRSVTLVGWGRKLPQGPFSDIMQMNKHLEISPSACRSRTFENGVICAGKPQSNLCEGDMGGPLIRNGGSANRDIQVGITSKVVGDCGTSRGPGLFTEVASVVSWIKQNT